MQSLVKSYICQMAVCGLLSLWLSELRAANASGKSTSGAAVAVGGGTAVAAKVRIDSFANKVETLAMISKRDPHEATSDDVHSLAEDIMHKLARGDFSNCRRPRRSSWRI